MTSLSLDRLRRGGEQLMEEAGYYRTPEQRLFQLVNLLWRAIRIVLDVGLHTRGMTTREAVDYMVKHLPIERRSAEAEVRRYCAWPTYQLCYAVGRRELLRLGPGAVLDGLSAQLRDPIGAVLGWIAAYIIYKNSSSQVGASLLYMAVFGAAARIFTRERFPTAHGVAMAYVLTTFFIMGFGYYVAETSLRRPRLPTMALM